MECTILLFELEQSLDGRAREGEAGSSGKKKKNPGLGRVMVPDEAWLFE